MSKRDPELERVGDILRHSLKRLDLSGRLSEYGVWPIWNEIVGATIARNAQPEKIRNGTLFVKVTSSIWMQQLQYVKEMIAEKLNKDLGNEVVKNIFFFVGKIGSAMPEPTAKDLAATEEPSQARPQLQDEYLQPINDPEIRRALKKLFAAYSRKRKNSASTS